MGQAPRPDTLETAIAWRIRLRDSAAGEWDAFVEWLEQDPAHSAAYDSVALADTGIDDDMLAGLPAVTAANDDGIEDATIAPPLSRRGWLAGAVALAATIVAAIGLSWQTAPSSLYQVATAPGEQRRLMIADGSSVALNGGTRVILDRRNNRFAELAAGEATFTIRHDASDPFKLVVGNDRVQDVGTVFNILHDPKRTSVEVIEGAILYNPDDEAISLSAGQTLASIEGQEALILGRKDPGLMAGWRQGQLNYVGAPLTAVASDLSRSLGVAIDVAPALTVQSFTGTVRIAGGDAATLARLSSTLDLNVRRTGKGWLLEPHQRARP